MSRLSRSSQYGIPLGFLNQLEELHGVCRGDELAPAPPEPDVPAPDVGGQGVVRAMTPEGLPRKVSRIVVAKAPLGTGARQDETLRLSVHQAFHFKRGPVAESFGVFLRANRTLERPHGQQLHWSPEDATEILLKGATLFHANALRRPCPSSGSAP